MRHTSTLFGIVASCLLAFSPGLIAAEADSEAPLPADHPSTASVCAECHEGESQIHANHRECTTCHVNASTHAAAKSPRKTAPGLPKTEQCLTCHQKDESHMNFRFSDHDKAGVACSDCHGVHAPKLKRVSLDLRRADDGSAICATCHQDVLARFDMPSHHPVKEGGVSCLGCHDQHGSENLSLAGKTEKCLACHQRMRGPYVFEHPPVVEDCANCHNAHGSANRRLLTMAQPMLCLQCHSLPNNRHGQAASSGTAAADLAQPISGALLRGCSNCHGTIHGSAQDQHLRY